MFRPVISYDKDFPEVPTRQPAALANLTEELALSAGGE